ncbi:MAG: hypothetical protein LPH21_16730, partial [Shewanella sp.]|nr:hypothetical protein [Shewanella sp.]
MTERRRPGRGTAKTPNIRRSAANQSGRDRLKAELKKQEQRKAEREAMREIPFRFFVKKGHKSEIIICDEEPTFWRYEHNYKGEDGKRSQYVACLQETEICPACIALQDAKPYYAMFLTVIDCTGFTDSKGNHIPYTKKLLAIKSQQQEKWLRRIDSHIEKYGTLRGACVDIYRSESDTSPATGDDIEFIGH